MLLVTPRAGLSSTIAQKCFISLFEMGSQLMSVLPMSGRVYVARHQNQETARNTVFRYKLAQTFQQ